MNKQVEIQKIIELVREHNSQIIPESFSKQIFENVGMPTPKQGLAKNEEEAVYLAKTIGFPVVLKVHSFNIVHKSDARGVLVGLNSPEDVREGFLEIIKNAQSYLLEDKEVQVTVQEMAPVGTEVIIGMKRDKVFGPTILFGLGGVWVEVLKDVSLRVSPLTEQDVDDMINEIRGHALLGEFRGNRARDLSSLKTLIFQMEKLALEFPEIDEIDLNPVFLYEKDKGAMVVDARIVLTNESLISEGTV
ncbi:hypothetical protein BTR23_09475 [Alkalihalophilus pseudofirmus]|nr:hypothetical protein BTR23_09475 [Alkalihalophilus pseudofirmus]